MLTRRAAFQSMLFGAAAAGAAQARKPNLVVILADDMGYGDIGCYGSPDVPTPNIDALARSGVRFTDGYVSAAVCSPSRAALLTGRYQHRFGHEFNSGAVEREAQIGFGLPKSETILPAYLRAHGYKSGMYGKWHLGVNAGYHPLERGFDEFVGFLPGGDDFVTERTPGARVVASDTYADKAPAKRAAPILRGREVLNDDRYLTELLSAEAVDFIDRNQKNPFFLYMPFNAIHTPLQATEKYVARFASMKNEKHKMLAAMTAALDESVGAILTKLRETRLEKDTMVVFLSDNGCPEQTGAGTNGPLNGEKVTYFEGGIRVPFMMRWTGHLPAGQTYRHPVVSRDILPTFMAAAGIPLPSAKVFDGVNLLPYLTGKDKQAPHDILFWRAGSARAVRKGKWKLLEFGDSYTKLFDLAEDLGETKDLSAQRPDIVKELQISWKNWSNSMRPAAWPPRYRKATVNGDTLNWEI